MTVVANYVCVEDLVRKLRCFGHIVEAQGQVCDEVLKQNLDLAGAWHFTLRLINFLKQPFKLQQTSILINFDKSFLN